MFFICIVKVIIDFSDRVSVCGSGLARGQGEVSEGEAASAGPLGRHGIDPTSVAAAASRHRTRRYPRLSSPYNVPIHY